MRRERATWDEGWVGKGVNGCGPGDESQKPPNLEVKDGEDRLLLYVIEDGQMYRLWCKERAGYR